MNEPQVIACFVIYSGEHIAYQGTFQVLEEINLYSHQSTDIGVFSFQHHYEGTQCHIKLAYSQGESVEAQLDLEIPINRSKIKWKKAMLGDMYDVHYRCALEFAEHSKELRKILRRSAIARINRKSDTYSISKFDCDEGS